MEEVVSIEQAKANSRKLIADLMRDWFLYFSFEWLKCLLKTLYYSSISIISMQKARSWHGKAAPNASVSLLAKVKHVLPNNPFLLPIFSGSICLCSCFCPIPVDLEPVPTWADVVEAHVPKSPNLPPKGRGEPDTSHRYFRAWGASLDFFELESNLKLKVVAIINSTNTEGERL